MTIKTKEGFQAWKDNPLTREYLQYLRDRQSNLKEAWARGKLLTVEQQAQAVLLGQLAEMGWDEIAAQYEIATAEVSE